MTSLPRNTILTGDATSVLRGVPEGSIDCVITSPPYYQLRDYGVVGQHGLEPTVDDWVDGLRQVFVEVARVLKPAGVLWLNLADSFSRHARYGAPPKGLLLGPERLLLALAGDGWLVRNKVIWAKPNPMPSSVGDRLSLTYEVVYFLVRTPRYYFDLDAIREPHRSHAAKRGRAPLERPPGWAGPLAGSQDGLRRPRAAGTRATCWARTRATCGPSRRRDTGARTLRCFPRHWYDVHCSPAARPRSAPAAVSRSGATDRCAGARRRGCRAWCSTRSSARAPSASSPGSTAGTGWASSSTPSTSSSRDSGLT